MATKCPECSHKFTRREALCVDWKDPEKSFGCPNCGTFFTKGVPYEASTALAGGIAAGGILCPATFIASSQIINENGDVVVAFQAVVIVLSWFVITLLNSPKRKLFAPLKKSPYVQSSNADVDGVGS